MRELDVLLARFLARDWPQAAEEHRDAFRRLLELPDPELAALCFGRAAAADPALAVVVARMLEAAPAGSHGPAGPRAAG